jgi:hypothetical protein
VVGKYSINLLQAELLPEKVFLTFSRVIALWLACLIIMVAWALLTHLQYQSLNLQNNDLKLEKVNQTNLMTTLQQQLTNRKVDSALEEKLSTLKSLFLHKDALHNKLTDKKQTFVSGFALAMSELSELHHNDIRLQSITINNENMSFKGFAKTPETVPAWLAGFQYSTLLSGKAFVHFKLTKNEQNMTEFIVSSSAIEEGIE